jgi:hypothetical protein
MYLGTGVAALEVVNHLLDGRAEMERDHIPTSVTGGSPPRRAAPVTMPAPAPALAVIGDEPGGMVARIGGMPGDSPRRRVWVPHGSRRTRSDPPPPARI